MNYKTTIEVKSSQKNTFKAVSKELNKWWGRVDNSDINKVGDIFSVYFEDTEWQFEITKFSMHDEIHWKCIFSNHTVPGLENVKEEWLNTEIVWKLKEVEEGVEISFEHVGLTPALNCYDVCNNGWDFFINSLKDYLENEGGSPRIVE
ncbi:MAG: SRPBCC domain-containing protein [Flavobacteriales bacterium]|nr:SRPBCC domain-containing protein [Flavobacteriales bacterium]NQX98652.1 SRPBCC domain-containing protein [Flavobacteriales bacterium]